MRLRKIIKNNDAAAQLNAAAVGSLIILVLFASVIPALQDSPSTEVSKRGYNDAVGVASNLMQALTGSAGDADEKGDSLTDPGLLVDSFENPPDNITTEPDNPESSSYTVTFYVFEYLDEHAEETDIKTPVGKADVQLYKDGGGYDLNISTEDDGLAEFPEVGEGSYIWSVSKEGYISRSGSVYIDSDDQFNVELTAIDGGSLYPPEIWGIDGSVMHDEDTGKLIVTLVALVYEPNGYLEIDYTFDWGDGDFTTGSVFPGETVNPIPEEDAGGATGGASGGGSSLDDQPSQEMSLIQDTSATFNIDYENLPDDFALINVYHTYDLAGFVDNDYVSYTIGLDVQTDGGEDSAEKGVIYSFEYDIGGVIDMIPFDCIVACYESVLITDCWSECGDPPGGGGGDASDFTESGLEGSSSSSSSLVNLPTGSFNLLGGVLNKEGGDINIPII